MTDVEWDEQDPNLDWRKLLTGRQMEQLLLAYRKAFDLALAAQVGSQFRTASATARLMHLFRNGRLLTDRQITILEMLVAEEEEDN